DDHFGPELTQRLSLRRRPAAALAATRRDDGEDSRVCPLDGFEEWGGDGASARLEDSDSHRIGEAGANKQAVYAVTVRGLRLDYAVTQRDGPTSRPLELT